MFLVSLNQCTAKRRRNQVNAFFGCIAPLLDPLDVVVYGSIGANAMSIHQSDQSRLSHGCWRLGLRFDCFELEWLQLLSFCNLGRPRLRPRVEVLKEVLLSNFEALQSEFLATELELDRLLHTGSVLADLGEEVLD